MNTKAKGNIGEALAAEYLEERGYRIIGRNVELTSCEVDIIAEAYFDKFGNLIRLKPQKGNFVTRLIRKIFKKSASIKQDVERTLVFVEVKTRESEEHGAPEEAVDAYKKGRYVTAAKSYLAKHSEQNTPIRFDVITVENGEVNHIENAFEVNDARYPRR